MFSLFVDHALQNTRSALSRAWNQWFPSKSKEWKIFRCRFALSTEPQIWKFHVIVWPTTSKHCIKKRATRAARLFFLIQPMKSLICDVVTRSYCRRHFFNSLIRSLRNHNDDRNKNVTNLHIWHGKTILCFARAIFIFGHFADVIVLTTTWNDPFCSRPFPSSPKSFLQSESKCEIFVMVITSNFNMNENWFS